MNSSKKAIGAVAASVLLAGLYSTIGASTAQAVNPHGAESEIALASTITAGPFSSTGTHVQYRLKLTDVWHPEGKSFIHLAFNSALQYNSAVSLPDKFSGPQRDLSGGGWTIQANDLKTGDVKEVVLDLTVVDLSQVGLVTAEAEAAGDHTTVASTASPAVSITSSAPTPGQIGHSYAFPVASAGYFDRTYSATGLSGLGLGIDSSTGLISGTPNAVGSFPIAVTARDSAGATATASYSLIVNGNVPNIVTVGAPSATVGSGYSFAVKASGVPTAQYGITGGHLPNGLTLNKSTGVISGKPTVAGSFTFSVSAANNVGSDSHDYEIVVTKVAGGTE